MLRFKNDDGSEFPEWEEHEIAELIQLYNEKVSSDCQLPILTSSKKNGIEYQEKHFTGKQRHDIEGYNVLPRSYCTYRNRSDGTDFRFNINKLCDKGIVSKFYPVFKEKDCDLFFLVSLLNNERKTVRKIAYTAKGTGQKVLSITDLRNITVNMPSLSEQQKIAEFLSMIDTVIQKQKETVSAWEERKKGVMQKLFSQEVRFKADDGSDFPEWEEKKVGSLGNIVGGGTPSTKQKEYWCGKTVWVSSADISDNDIYNINMTRFITQDAIDDSATKIIPRDSILIVSRVGVGKVAKASCNLCTSQDFTNIVNPDGDATFLSYAILRLMQSKLQCVQGTSIKGIPSDEIKNYMLRIPWLEEQQKIAGCLSALDEVIENQKATLAAWEELKKGLLQQMFM